MNATALKAFTETNTWRHKMDNSQGIDGWSNFGGRLDHPDWIVVQVGRNRDSEIQDESNFAAALEMLGGEGKDVEVCQFGHWGCGWFELILVNPKNKSKLKIAFDIKQRLDRYPILDESDFAEREQEYQASYANDAKKRLADALSKHFKVKNTKTLVSLAFDLNMECQSYYGNDSCIDVYECRKPDERDVRRLKQCLERVVSFNETSRTLKALRTAVEKYRA